MNSKIMVLFSAINLILFQLFLVTQHETSARILPARFQLSHQSGPGLSYFTRRHLTIPHLNFKRRIDKDRKLGRTVYAPFKCFGYTSPRPPPPSNIWFFQKWKWPNWLSFSFNSAPPPSPIPLHVNYPDYENYGHYDYNDAYQGYNNYYYPVQDYNQIPDYYDQSSFSSPVYPMNYPDVNDYSGSVDSNYDDPSNSIDYNFIQSNDYSTDINYDDFSSYSDGGYDTSSSSDSSDYN